MKICFEATRRGISLRWSPSIDRPTVERPIVADGEEMTRESLRQMILDEAGHFLRDMEWRYKQARDLYEEVGLRGLASGNVIPLPSRKITAEDIDDTRHRLTGYTVTANSPGAGSIAWAGLHIVYNGVDYTVVDGNTALKYVWFVKPGSGTSATLSMSNTKPTLTADDILVFINNGGTPIVAASDGAASLPRIVGDNAVDNGAIVANAVDTAKLANNAVDSTKLADGAVSTSLKLADNIVSGTKLTAGAVSPTKLNILAHVLY